MKIRFGLVKTTLIDYPGKVAASLFTHGCNLRCPFCHNPELVDPNSPVPDHFVPAEEAAAFLEKRKSVLEGVCISGGEPLLHSGMSEFVGDIQRRGYSVKIDTNGLLPEQLAECAPDFIAMDVKTAPSRYERLGFTGADAPYRLSESIKYITSSKIPRQFRTTLVPGIVTAEDLAEIANIIPPGSEYILNKFRPGITLDPGFSEKLPYTDEETREMVSFFRKKGIDCRMS